MRAFASSFHAWKSIERHEGIRVPHGLVFSLAVVEAIGRPYGLVLDAEEHCANPDPARHDAIFLSALDSRCLISAARHFARWRVPFRRHDRATGRWPLVWAGGQGLHNPRPLAPVADLIVIGDAEGPLPTLLALWDVHGNTPAFLRAAADVPGVFVPAHHHPTEVTIEQAVADTIGVTLDTPISVSLDGTRRLEIARGCRYKCTFCSLGWRTPVRENSAESVVRAIHLSPKRVHLQAGDAESHSGIDTIRRALRARGGSDQGWTGRLDSLFENPDQTIPGQKRYAFGVEGVSYRLRRAVGKAYLTDDRLITDTLRFFASIEDDRIGRAAWHLMAGLPTESRREVISLMYVLRAINEGRRGKTSRYLALHWQPFCPLPGTPMQWCACGGGARDLMRLLQDTTARLPWVHVRHLVGRTDDMAQLCTILARSDERGADLLEAVAAGRVTIPEAEQITGTTAGALDVEASLPWDFIAQWQPKPVLQRAYRVMMERLHEREVA